MGSDRISSSELHLWGRPPACGGLSGRPPRRAKSQPQLKELPHMTYFSYHSSAFLNSATTSALRSGLAKRPLLSTRASSFSTHSR